MTDYWCPLAPPACWRVRDGKPVIPRKMVAPYPRELVPLEWGAAAARDTAQRAGHGGRLGTPPARLGPSGSRRASPARPDPEPGPPGQGRTARGKGDATGMDLRAGRLAMGGGRQDQDRRRGPAPVRRARTCRIGLVVGQRRGLGRLRSARFRQPGSESGRRSRGCAGRSSCPVSACSCSGSSRPEKRILVRCRRRRTPGTGAGSRTESTART